MIQRRRTWWQRGSGLLLPVMPAFSGGYPGCCNCPHCGHIPPLEMQVTLTGVADDWCSDCDETWNDTFILERQAQGLNDECIWKYEGGTWCGGAQPKTVHLYLDQSLGDYRLRVFLGLNVPTMQATAIFLKNFGASRPSCRFDGQDVPYNSRSWTYCDSSGATCTVSAV
jgi:hypothetical protein